MGSGFLLALATLAKPITARVLLALGFSVVTVTGVALSVSTVKGLVLSSLGTAPMAALQLAGLMGVWEAGGLVFGAMTWCVSFWTLTSATKLIGTGS